MAPFRLTFAAKEPILPLRLAGAGAAERLDLRCWVQAADQMDLPGDLSYEYHWVLLLQHAVAEQKGLLSGKGEDWLQALQVQLPDLVKKSKELGFTFVKNQLPQPNRKGRTVAVLEWAKRLTPTDLLALKGEVPLSERVPDPDEGFTETDLRNPARAEAIRRVIRERLERYRKDRPAGFLVREGVGPDVKGLPALAVTLQQGRFLTRFHKMLTRDEPAEDVVPVPASFGPARDASEYEERLPGSPP